MPNLLAIETATQACSVALYYQQDIVTEQAIQPRQHAEFVLPMIDKLFADCGCQLNSLDAIAFGCGPGSFMGCRLAAGVAQGLALACQVPVISISTLETLAQQAADESQLNSVAAAWDARLGAMYWGAYHREASANLRTLQRDQVIEPAKLILPEGHNWCAVGNGWQQYRHQLSAEVIDSIKVWMTDIYPSAGTMIKIALHKFSVGDVLPGHLALPNYCRHEVANTRT